jgi:hypothetical protein
VTEDGAKLLVAALAAAFPSAEAAPETATVYRLALERFGDDEVATALPGVMERHAYPQRLPSPKEIADAIGPPWALYRRWGELRGKGERTRDEAAELAGLEARLVTGEPCGFRGRPGRRPALGRGAG